MNPMLPLQLVRLTVPVFKALSKGPAMSYKPPPVYVSAVLPIASQAPAPQLLDPRFWLAGELVVMAADFATLQRELVSVAAHRFDLLDELEALRRDLRQALRRLEAAEAVNSPPDPA